MHLSVISYELKIVAYSAIFGCIFAFIYDIIKLVRELLKYNGRSKSFVIFTDLFLVQITDIIYALIFSVSFSILIYYFNCGIFRWYFAVAAFTGFWVYRHSVGIVVYKVLCTVVGFIRYLVRIFVFSPFIFIIRVIKKIASPIGELIEYSVGILRTDKIKKNLILSIKCMVQEGEINSEQKKDKCIC